MIIKHQQWLLLLFSIHGNKNKDLKSVPIIVWLEKLNTLRKSHYRLVCYFHVYVFYTKQDKANRINCASYRTITRILMSDLLSLLAPSLVCSVPLCYTIRSGELWSTRANCDCWRMPSDWQG